MARKLPDQPLRLHRFARSGHCHRVELLLSMLELPVELIDVNLAQGEHKTSRFLQLNSFGQVPVLEDGARIIADSNATLVYLATEYGDERWMPRSSVLAAEQQRWFSVAAGPLASGPALARMHHLFGALIDLAAATDRAHSLLRVMNLHLAETPFLVGSTLTLADVANYYNTLGNLRLNAGAGLLFIDVVSGDVLQLEATAELVVGSHPLAGDAGTGRVVRFDVQRVRFFPRASALRFISHGGEA